MSVTQTRVACLFFSLCLLMGACGGNNKIKIDRTNLTDVGTGSDPLDYSNPNLWICRPDIDPNECDRVDLDATDMISDGSRHVVTLKRAGHPAFDCFYVYPTVLIGSPANMTDFSDVTPIKDPLFGQAAPFRQLCQVYAPLYRQAALFAPGANQEINKADVKAAFQYYLDHLNKGRKFVLLGHSQGSGMLEFMMQDMIDNNADIRSRMISALVIGDGVTVAKGQNTGGTFQNIPLCSQDVKTGCIVTYNLYEADDPLLHYGAVLGRVIETGGMFPSPPTGIEVEPACTNPAQLAYNSDTFSGALLPTKTFNPALGSSTPSPSNITTTFLLYRDTFQGACTKSDDGTYNQLVVSRIGIPNDQRSLPPYQSEFAELIGFGLHLVDYQIPLYDLIDLVRQQADAMR